MITTTVEREIEIITKKEDGIEPIYPDDYRYLKIEFEVRGVYGDHGFSYSYGSIDGYQEDWGWDDVEIKWDKTVYSDEDNKIINDYVDKSIDSFIDDLDSAKDDWCD
jgi:hypothetical protein